MHFLGCHKNPYPYPTQPIPSKTPVPYLEFRKALPLNCRYEDVIDQKLWCIVGSNPH